MPKKLLTLTLCCALCLGLLSTAARAAVDEVHPEALAGDLYALGLFRGTGTNADGTANYELDRALTRAEAMVMLVRLLGGESAALDGEWTSPFTDVADWATPYVGYAYRTGLTNGISATLFGSDKPADCAMYLTCVLRALGYRDRSDDVPDEYDFLWNAPFALANYCGILPLAVNTGTFLRRDAVLVSYAALTAMLKGTEQTLAEKLLSGGAFTQEQYDGAIDEAVFSGSEAVNAAIRAAALAHEDESSDDYSFTEECHEILETAEDGDTLTVSAMICCRTYEFTRFGEDKSSSVTWIPASIALHKLADGSYETVSYWTSDQADAVAAKFSPSVSKKIRTTDFGYMLAVCDLQKEAYLASGAISFERKTYEDALEELLSQPYTSVEARLEAPSYGTILCRLVPAGMHGLTPTLCMVTNDKSPLGEARVIYFPLPSATVYLSAEPEQLALNERGDTLTYQVTHDDDFIIPNDPDDPDDDWVLYRKGTFYYSADLATGEVTETFIAVP